MSLAVFANFRIDSMERLQRMKDSFQSFHHATIDQWVVNIRGEYQDSALYYLNEKLGSKLNSSKLESKQGWFFDSQILFKKIQTDYIFAWVEDHICMCGHVNFNKIVNNMSAHGVEYLGYSWFGGGLSIDEFKDIKKNEIDNLYCLTYDKFANRKRQKNALKLINHKAYIISLNGFFHKNLFSRILHSKRPYLRRWPKITPFDFEKSWNDTWILPIVIGVPKFEMFAPIDDDNQYPNSSLFSRGLYPIRISRDTLQKSENANQDTNKFSALKFISRKIVFFSWFKHLLKRITYHL